MQQNSRAWSAAWIIGTIVVWLAWHRLLIAVATLVTSMVVHDSVPTGSSFDPATPGGIFDYAVQIPIHIVVGLLFGLIGVACLRLLGAPRIVWLSATGVSMLAYLATAVMWAGFSGSGTGWAHIGSQFALSLLLGAAVGIGALLGARSSVRLRHVPSEQREAD